MGPALRLGGRTFLPGDLVVMAIINRTPDSFFDRGATYAQDDALRAVEQAVRDGADIIDIGGVKAGPGVDVDTAEEIRRTVPTIAAVRAAFPDVVISIDSWRAAVATEAVAAGADLINDTWSGADPEVAQVAADTGAGLVCSHAGALPPRARPHGAVFV
jgi:dihydropteroate synthase